MFLEFWLVVVCGVVVVGGFGVVWVGWFLFEVSQVFFRLCRWEILEYA